MRYKLTYSSIFHKSYSEIVTYLSDFSSKTAADFSDQLEQQTAILVDLPRLYPKYKHNNKLNIDISLRKLTLTDYNYVLFYLVDDNKKEVKLYYIVHTSRDIEVIMAKIML